MRIALIHMRHAAVGGTERFLNRLAAHLGAGGHDVVIVCRRHEESPHPRATFAVLHGPALGSAWRAWRFAQDVERHVRGQRYDVVLGLGKTWTHDVVRCGGGCHQTYMDLADRFTRSGWERALGVGSVGNRVALALERRACAPGAARRIIAVSDMVRRDLIARHGLRAGDIELIHNGVDLARFHPRHRAEGGAALRRRLGWGPDALVFLFLGTGFGRKGLSPLLDAFARLAADRPDARLLVAGRDGGSRRFEAHARALGLGARVQFLGETGAPHECYGAADVYVLPTFYDAFAFTILEALASGLPVLPTDRAGAAELLTPAQGEVLRAAELDSGAGVDALEAALRRWCDRELRAAAAPAARALAERHPFERTLEATTRVLLDAAAGISAGAAGRPASGSG